MEKNECLGCGSQETITAFEVKYHHMRSNIFLVVSVVATIALLAVIMPLGLSLQDDKAQALVHASTVMPNGNSMTSPHHNMAMMVMGQDNSIMKSDKSSGSQDSPIPNKP
jgi:hypothetical protein